jgi:hypothetical protein
MYVRKDLASVISIWFLHVILLSKVTPKYVTLFTRECLVRLAVRRQGLYKSSGEIDLQIFPFIDLYVPALTPRIHCSEAALQFSENTTFMFFWCVNTGTVREQIKMSSRCRGGII